MSEDNVVIEWDCDNPECECKNCMCSPCACVKELPCEDECLSNGQRDAKDALQV